jgi:hypothetical protein
VGVDRRRFLLTSLTGALAVPRAVSAQTGKIPRVGALTFAKAASDTPADQGFRRSGSRSNHPCWRGRIT